MECVSEKEVVSRRKKSGLHLNRHAAEEVKLIVDAKQRTKQNDDAEWKKDIKIQADSRQYD